MIQHNTDAMRKVFLLFPVLIVICCNRPREERSAPSGDVSQLLTADREFSAYSASNGRNAAFLKYASDEAVMLRPNGYPIEGMNSIKKMVTSVSDTAFTLTWEPMKGVLAESGELGYTYGIYTLTLKDAVRQGSYITIWKKVDGKWKFVFDAGNEGLGN
jgi:ketosteroid isomerase-like protein